MRNSISIYMYPLFSSHNMLHLTYFDKEYHMTKGFNYNMFNSKTTSLRNCYNFYLNILYD